MFLKTVLADGTAEQTVIREMKARAAGARGDIEQIVRGVMADVQERGWDAVVEYAEKFDGKAPYIVEPSVLDAAYDACDPKLISALEKAAANIRDYHEQMLVKSWEWKRSAGETLGQTVRGLSRVGIYVPGGTAAYPSSVLMNAIPAKVITGLSVGGSMIGAVGFALLLNSIKVKKFWPFFLLGFFVAAYLNINMIGIALLAVICVAMYYYFKIADANA